MHSPWELEKILLTYESNNQNISNLICSKRREGRESEHQRVFVRQKRLESALCHCRIRE